MKIYGIITDAAEEKPLAKSKVVLYIGEIELVTFYSDKDGKFQVEQKLDQHIGETLICHVEKDNFKPREVTYKIEDEDIRLDIELIPIEREKPVEPPKEEIVPPPPPPPPPNMKWIKIAIAVGALIVAGIVVYFLIPGKRVIEKPEIISFDANPSQIMKGTSSTLSWQTSKAEEVEISDIGKISLSGSRKVSPRETTTYTLMARNEEGKEVGRKVTVKVSPIIRELSPVVREVSPVVREVLPVALLPDLYISEFSLSPSTPTQGKSVEVSIGVYNSGSARAGGFTVEWWAGENFPNPAHVWQVDGLAAKGGRILTYTYVGYRSWYGRLTTKAVADSKGKVKEQNENNNVRKMEIQVLKKQ